MVQFPNSIRELGCLPFSDYINSRSLSASTAETFIVPEGARFVVFSGTADFYAKPNATASVPADVTDGSASELNPTLRSVVGVSSVSVISESACVVSAAFFS